MGYKEEKEELIEGFKKSNEIYKEIEKQRELVKNALSVDTLKKRFAGVGTVCILKDEYHHDYYYQKQDRIILKNDLFDNGILELVKYCRRDADDENYGEFIVPFENKDFNIWHYINYTSSSINELESKVEQIKDLIDKFEKARKSVSILDMIKKYTDLKIERSSLGLVGFYNSCKESFMNEKYGYTDDEHKIAIGKTYYLLDAKGKDKIALVEVLSEDPSGLGYKCVDHEADDKKYSHVKASRLVEDIRDFPSFEDMENEARGNKNE